MMFIECAAAAEGHKWRGRAHNTAESHIDTVGQMHGKMLESDSDDNEELHSTSNWYWQQSWPRLHSSTTRHRNFKFLVAVGERQKFWPYLPRKFW